MNNLIRLPTPARVESDDLLRAAVAPATYDAYRSALRRLDDWHGARPVTDETLAAYLQTLYDSGRSAALGALTLKAVRFRAKVGDRPSPVGPITKMTMRGYRRSAMNRGRGQTGALQWADIDLITARTAEDGLVGLRDAAVIAVASDALLRASEVVAVDCQDVIDSTFNGAVLHVRRSKTDPHGRGATLYLGQPTADLIRRWRDAGGVSEGPLFRAVYGDRVGAGALSRRTIDRIIKRRAAECGFTTRITSHSPRVGAAQSLAAVGAGLVEMQQAGRWSDPTMPARYAAGEFAQRGPVARRRYKVNVDG